MVESDTPESDKDLKQRRPIGSTSSNGLFVTSPIIRGRQADFDEPPHYNEYDDKTLWILSGAVFFYTTYISVLFMWLTLTKASFVYC